MNKSFKISYIIFTLLIILFPSCKQEEKETYKPIECTPQTPYGICKNQDDICYKGNCIPKDAKCGKILAPCEDKYNDCVEDKENGGFKCVEGKCSYNNPDGICKKPDMICTSRGLCRYECSSKHPEGACKDENKTCIDGVCVNKSDLCSNIKPDGICKNGKTCSKKENDEEYTCLDSCSENNPNGACSTGKICKYGSCHYPYEICSKQNRNGICEEGKICHEGECKRICSEIVTNGVCQYEDQICKDGKCSYLCSQVRPDGVCEEIGMKCVDGTCKFKCSETVKDGYCENEEETCIDGYCKPICGPEHLNGACPDKKKICINGECKFECSEEFPFGVCEEEGYGCKNGQCIQICSSQYPNGACPQYNYCDNGTCKELPCSMENPHGPCQNQGEKCLNGICLKKCSPQQPNGWCENENYVCYNNQCTDPTSKPCSTYFQNGYCSAWDEECMNGRCIKKPCSPEYPDGRCDNGAYCNDGVCSYTCSDGRPILQEGETISLENGGISGACCVVNEDCKDGFDSYGYFPTNLCIHDHVASGPYCLGLQLVKDNNNPLVCGTVGGCNGCRNDEECADPYYNMGDPERYFCSMFTYFDFETPAGPMDINVSYCQRVFTFCERQHKGPGERCNENCHDAECETGLHCIKGFCTSQCKDDSYCVEETSCIPLYYHFPDTEKNVFVDVCIRPCENNNDCSILGNSYKCISYTYKHRVMIGETPAPKIAFCRPLDSSAHKNLREACLTDDDCKYRICGEQKLCTVSCKNDSDCGNNAYCSYENLMSGEIIYYNADNVPVDLNYLGICKYLDSNQGTPQSCSSINDCPNDTLNNRKYHCLPKFTLKKDIPEGKSGDSVSGVCGIITHSQNKAYSEEGELCDNNSQLCESGLCVCGNKLCKNVVGRCREYCETSNDCDGDKYCKRVRFRKKTQYSRAVYGGVCISRRENINITPCNTDSDNSANLCENGKTCISNPVNTKPEIDNPNKFGVEYICVKEKEGKIPLNQTCQKDKDCKSQLCNMNTHKCSHACTKNSQCNDVGSGQCKFTDILVQDLNPDYIVYGGICE